MDVFMRLPEEGSKQRANRNALHGNQERNRFVSRKKRASKRRIEAALAETKGRGEALSAAGKRSARDRKRAFGLAGEGVPSGFGAASNGVPADGLRPVRAASIVGAPAP